MSEARADLEDLETNLHDWHAQTRSKNRRFLLASEVAVLARRANQRPTSGRLRYRRIVSQENAEPFETLESMLLERLADSGLSDDISDVVLASLDGPDEIREALAQESGPLRALGPSGGEDAGPVAGVYLRSIDVEGYRGIGRPATLTLTPGPGLTLITGRNGSGKSSFAEAVELAMTGQNKRWAPPRSAVWREGWRNLHHGGSTRINVELAVDGEAGTTKIVREWADGAALDAGASFGQRKGKPQRALAEMGWGRALQLYRPFLSYAELGALVDGKPSEMYDAMARILGLDQLAAAERLLTETRKELDTTIKSEASARPHVQHLLEGRTELRAERVRSELAQQQPDLAALRDIVAEGVSGDDEQAGDITGSVLAITLPSTEQVQAAITRMEAAHRAVTDLAGGSADDAHRLVSLLGAALQHHAQHPDDVCPVCAGRTLDEAWAEATRSEITRLQALATTADAAHREKAVALASMRQLVGPLPRTLSRAAQDVDVAGAVEAWSAWVLVVDHDGEKMVMNAQEAFDQLVAAIRALQAVARDVVQQRVTAWAPIASAMGSWLELAHTAALAKQSLKTVKAALTWLKEAAQEIRDARLAPFASMSAKVWSELRQESNVELGPIHLAGISTSGQRRVALEVTIDGRPGAALAVMSQGELHALGLALFLPRAAASASPFRFLVIDDPVQSMDPAKVDGLARVLAGVARNRQVVVFSHDDRLAEAVRRLQVPATIWEVIRGEGSTVEVVRNDDPIGRYLSDARAVARTEDLSVEAQALVVVGMCRGALEAACLQRIRTQKLAAGVRHAEVEEAIERARKLHEKMTLALFDDATRGSDVLRKLADSFGGQAAVRAFKTAKTNVHAPYQGDLMVLVREVDDLAQKVRG